MTVADKLREVLDEWESEQWRSVPDERNGIQFCIDRLRALLDEPEAPTDAVREDALRWAPRELAQQDAIVNTQWEAVDG